MLEDAFGTLGNSEIAKIANEKSSEFEYRSNSIKVTSEVASEAYEYIVRRRAGGDKELVVEYLSELEKKIDGEKSAAKSAEMRRDFKDLATWKRGAFRGILSLSERIKAFDKKHGTDLSQKGLTEKGKARETIEKIESGELTLRNVTSDPTDVALREKVLAYQKLGIKVPVRLWKMVDALAAKDRNLLRKEKLSRKEAKSWARALFLYFYAEKDTMSKELLEMHKYAKSSGRNSGLEGKKCTNDCKQ